MSSSPPPADFLLLDNLLANDDVGQILLSNHLHDTTAQETDLLKHSIDRRSVLARQADEESMSKVHQERVKSAFQLIDINKDGELSAHEIIKAIHKNGDVRSILLLSDDSELSASEYSDLFSRIDVDSSAGVSYSEFEVFVDTIYREERERKVAEAKRKDEEEEEHLRLEKKLGLKKARDKVFSAQEDFDLGRMKFIRALGETEVESILAMVKEDPTKFLVSEKPFELELAELWFELSESKRLLKIQEEGGSSSSAPTNLDPKYDEKLNSFNSRHSIFARWKVVDDAFKKIAGEGRETAPLEDIINQISDPTSEMCSMLGITSSNREFEKTSGSPLADALFSAADEEEEKKSSGSPLADALFAAANLTTPATPPPATFSSFLTTAAEKLDDADALIKMLQSFRTIEITDHHFRITFAPEIGKVHSAFSLLACGSPNTPPPPNKTIEASELKSALLSNPEKMCQDYLNVTPGSPTFDRVYSFLSSKPVTSPINIDDFTSFFVQNYNAYKAYCNLSKCLPLSFISTDEASSMDREGLTEFYDKDIFAAHHLSNTSGRSISSVLENLPEENITRRHFVMLLYPKLTKILLRPKQYRDRDEEDEDDREDDLNAHNLASDDATAGDTNPNPKSITKSSVEAAFQLINPTRKRALDRKEVITALRDNKLVQRLLMLPTKKHAHNLRWKKMMAKLNSGKFEEVGPPEFINLFEDVQEDIDLEEKKLEERKRRGSLSRRNSKENAGVVVKKQIVPVLNVEMAEKYVNIRRAFDKLDLNQDGMLSSDELEEQCIRDEELRALLDISFEDIETVVRKLDIHVMSANIDWEMFRTFFIPMEEDGDQEAIKDNMAGNNRHRISEGIKDFTADQADIWRSGEMDADRMMHDMVVTMEAMIDTTKDDQEPSPALGYDGEAVEDLGWIDEERIYEQLAEEGPPPIPERGTEVSLATPYIDGPQWFVVLSPREELGMEGPMGIKSLLDYWDDEIIDSHTLVWKEGLQDWLPIEDVADLKAQLLLPELHSNLRPATAPGAISGFQKKAKKIVDPKPTKLDVIDLSKPCHWCGGIATSHIDAVQSYRPLQQGLKDGIAVATDDMEKTEILNDFIFLGNAAASRERNVEIMEYTHIINCSVALPCYWDLDDEVNSWLRNNVKEGADGKEIGDDRAILKLRRLRKLGVKYFRVKLDDDPFGRPDTAASRYTAESWKESEFSSRPLTALTDPLFASRPGSRDVRIRPGSKGSSRPMTGGGSRPLTAAEIEVIPEFEHTEDEETYALGYSAAAITIQSSYRGSKSRESSRPGTSEPPPIPAAIPMSKEQLEAIEEAKKKLDFIKKQVVDQIINSFEAVFEWLSRENLGRKVRCLVHSKSGMCSAAAVVAAYTIRTQGLTYNEVLSHIRTKHGIERIQIVETVWEDALKIYSSRYSIGMLICDDCFLENFVEGKGDDRVFSEEVEKVVERLKANDKSLQQLDLRDEILGGGLEKDEEGEKDANEGKGGEGFTLLCEALRDSYWLLELNLSGNEINDRDCVSVGSALLTNDGLNVLNLSYNKIGDAGAKEIAAALKLHTLSVLDISYNVIGPGGGTDFGKMLRHNEHLTTLGFGNNKIGDVGGHDLFDSLTTPLYESEEVMMKKAKVYEEGGVVDDIGEAFNCCLTSLDVSCNGLGQESAKRLVGVLQVNLVLTVLNLDYNPNLGNAEVREIVAAIRTHGPSIERLSFSENNVGNDVAGAFARAIGDSTSTVTRVSMAHNCLRSTGVSRLAGAMKENKVLVSMDLSRNPMGSKGLLHLSEALKANNCLRELILDCCGIDAEGCKGLAEALKINKTLVKLDLADNNLLTDGLVALAEGIKENKGVRELNLTNTGVGVKASERLADALIVNKVLEVLNMSSNQIRNHGCKKLSEMLGENNVLRMLDLSFNYISAIGIASMMDVLASTREGRTKSLGLDVKLTGNQYSKMKDEVENSQVVVPPKLARSKITWDHKSEDNLDRTMWSKKKENNNFVRRPSFSDAAGEAFDLDDGSSKFSITNNLITSKSMETFGVITDQAEPVDVPRWRANMEEHGNDVAKIKGPDTWNDMFKFEKVKDKVEVGEVEELEEKEE